MNSSSERTSRRAAVLVGAVRLAEPHLLELDTVADLFRTATADVSGQADGRRDDGYAAGYAEGVAAAAAEAVGLREQATRQARELAAGLAAAAADLRARQAA